MARRGSLKRNLEPLPEIPIAAVLRELTGTDDIPTGFGWVRMRCAFHEDRTASASVNHDVNGYRCHSCERRGDSLKLLQSERGLSFTEALNLGRQLAGIEPGAKSTKARKRRASELLGES